MVPRWSKALGALDIQYPLSNKNYHWVEGFRYWESKPEGLRYGEAHCEQKWSEIVARNEWNIAPLLGCYGRKKRRISVVVTIDICKHWTRLTNLIITTLKSLIKDARRQLINSRNSWCVGPLSTVSIIVNCLKGQRSKRCVVYWKVLDKCYFPVCQLMLL